jgi:hypothetical protein
MSFRRSTVRMARAPVMLAALLLFGGCAQQLPASPASSPAPLAPSASAATSAGAPATCTEAFTALRDVASPTDDQLNAIVTTCSSVDEITQMAKGYPGVIADADVRAWVLARCATIADRANHPICDH